ncbi:MAG: nuclear transport factor 2 family protein [Steroidobacteraceae bacterium]
MTDPDALAALESRVTALACQVARLEDTHAVKCLHYKYGYYIDKCLYEEAVTLFADGGEVRFLNGIYRGNASIRRLYCSWFRKYFTGGTNGPVRGLLLDHLLLQDIVDVAGDGLTAKGRFRCVLQGGCHESMREPVPNFPRQFWEAGIYENTYVKEGGIWKIQCLHYDMLWQADYHQGWANSDARLTPITRTYPDDPNGPDELLPEAPGTWPETRVVPFHYPHPVTKKSWEER